MAGAELEEQLLTEVNAIKDKMAEGQAYLQELTEAGEDKAEEIKRLQARGADSCYGGRRY